MGTKASPGAYDCYANLEPDEPYFVLRAKDPMAAALVRNWSDLRRQQVEMGHKPPEDIAQVMEARSCAVAMERWRAEYMQARIDEQERAAGRNPHGAMAPGQQAPAPEAEPVPLTASEPTGSQVKDPP